MTKAKERGFIINPYVLGAGAPPPFTPLALPGLLRWYDATDAATITEVSGRVTQWDDKTGSGNNATPSATTTERYIKTAASINGLTAMVNTTGAGFMNIPTCVLTASSYYAFMVLCNTSNTIGLGTTSGGNHYMCRLSNYLGGSLINGYLNSNDVYSGLGAGTSNNTPHVVGQTCNASGLVMHYDALTYAAAGHTAAYNVKQLTTESLAGYGLAGKVGEIIMGNAVLTLTEIANVKAYLKTKWGTP